MVLFLLVGFLVVVFVAGIVITLRENRKPRVFDDTIDDEEILEKIRKRKERINQLHAENEELSIALNKSCSFNNQGIKFEKDGDIDSAIACYEQNILPDCYLTLHPYYRLVVIYRRRKDFDNEIRVIDAFIQNGSRYPEEVEKFKIRREKALKLKSKNK